VLFYLPSVDIIWYNIVIMANKTKFEKSKKVFKKVLFCLPLADPIWYNYIITIQQKVTNENY